MERYWCFEDNLNFYVPMFGIRVVMSVFAWVIMWINSSVPWSNKLDRPTCASVIDVAGVISCYWEIERRTGWYKGITIADIVQIVRHFIRIDCGAFCVCVTGLRKSCSCRFAYHQITVSASAHFEVSVTGIAVIIIRSNAVIICSSWFDVLI